MLHYLDVEETNAATTSHITWADMVKNSLVHPLSDNPSSTRGTMRRNNCRVDHMSLDLFPLHAKWQSTQV